VHRGTRLKHQRRHTRRHRLSPAHPAPRLNLRPGPTSWFHPFTYKRFHVLLNSLFKVLCNFPSRYLFAIGLAVIFSLSRSLPATLGCTLKQPDSNVAGLALSGETFGVLWGFHPLWHPFHGNLHGQSESRQTPRHTRSTALKPVRTRGLCAGLFPFHSPLLGESLLVSFPPLNDMLKSSGLSCLSEVVVMWLVSLGGELIKARTPREQSPLRYLGAALPVSGLCERG
jgi:hypothetical protein